jgi:hypothetical protein
MRMNEPTVQSLEGAASDELALREACKYAVAGLMKAAEVDGLDDVDRALLVGTQRRFAQIGGLTSRARAEERLSKAHPGSPAGARPRSVVTSLRLTPAQHEALRDLAAREHRSVSQQLWHLIEGRLLQERSAEPERQTGAQAAPGVVAWAGADPPRLRSR